MQIFMVVVWLLVCTRWGWLVVLATSLISVVALDSLLFSKLVVYWDIR